MENTTSDGHYLVYVDCNNCGLKSRALKIKQYKKVSEQLCPVCMCYSLATMTSIHNLQK